MFVPLISYNPSDRTRIKRQDQVEGLKRRKGGGGGRAGGGSRSSSSSSSSSGRGSSSSSSGSRGSSSSGSRPGTSSGVSSSSRSSPISAGGSSGTTSTGRTASPFSSGGGPITSIPSGSMFAGRNQGGGTRNEVYGTRSYGSGYPGVSGLGVSNRGFPFYFWPVTWGAASGYTATHYYHDADSEYGLPGNSSRPGGVISFATFSSNTQNTTFHVVSDNATITNLITDIYFHCSSSINNSTSTTTPVYFNESDPSAPSPQSVIQYYRASSVALTLDGYNNSATWANATDSTPDTPLPTNIDTTLQNCLNQTIGQTALLMDSVSDNGAVPALSVDAHFLALFLVCLHLVKTLF